MPLLLTSCLSYEVSKDNHFHNNIHVYMKMVNVILNFFGYNINVLSNDIHFLYIVINECIADSKGQESIQSSFTSDKGHHMGK